MSKCSIVLHSDQMNEYMYLEKQLTSHKCFVNSKFDDIDLIPTEKKIAT